VESHEDLTKMREREKESETCDSARGRDNYFMIIFYDFLVSCFRGCVRE
jgi:hypothetical protein